ncbi:DoxX family membrane protein [Carboxylicivirga sp. M1479]|uniref:DoxX family membrane protein n=1 Tax=Carboxylicivirga sp. M1479 TaxID=2594476 RepID=UPI0011774516|nr:DoxX family membrane protein [Carboxylicivirga sp. M1479]TRX72083.1 DoxX family membrane protein [Carboxylicivirga sp. M1479]
MMNFPKQLSAPQLYSMVALRILLGWYLLYEGLAKLFSPHWSSFGYLKSSQGFLSDFFIGIADNSALVDVINLLNIWGLIAIGLAHVLGLLGRFSSLMGVLLISLYYLAHPPLIHVNEVLLSNENTLWVDKNLIFISVLFVLYLFPTSRVIGLDRFIFYKKG